jgi:hypothetical protein
MTAFIISFPLQGVKAAQRHSFASAGHCLSVVHPETDFHDHLVIRDPASLDFRPLLLHLKPCQMPKRRRGALYGSFDRIGMAISDEPAISVMLVSMIGQHILL